ncbi:MAG: 2-hydroxyacyl-CoA dehydratase family protein [Candidatus Accumulibacter sp.]|jgi:benzoyl-CoA reductase/2-hydroxyglutaryl-CoA dehydratase subunit BcrC/BadD/HgdB|nr:2-hydroxyacyl-CoA dehydratase family protein [Accumulibacter sp.]
MSCAGAPPDRRQRIEQKAAQKVAAESEQLLAALRQREDCRPEFEAFLRCLSTTSAASAADAARRSGRPLLKLLCVQAPLELIHAAGFHPFRVFSGSLAASALAAGNLPALTCPLLRAVLGELRLNAAPAAGWVLPATCDWVTRFPEMLRLCEVDDSSAIWWLELPRLKNRADGRERWLTEIWRLKEFLERLAGRGIGRNALLDSIAAYARAAAARQKLRQARIEGRLAPLWFMLVMSAFFLDEVSAWTASVERLLAVLTPQRTQARENGSGRVFLAGSPIVFPNFKLPLLLEEAGLSVVADDLCSSERIFPGTTVVEDESLFGLVSALAGSYHQGCLCPVFADNERRVNNIFNQRDEAGFQGVVFNVLKGCHPYDLESYSLEAPLKAQGLKFIRLETDYTQEDRQNLLTRLEAYRGIR